MGHPGLRHDRDSRGVGGDGPSATTEGEGNALVALLDGPALLVLTVAVGAFGLGAMWWLKKRSKR